MIFYTRQSPQVLADLKEHGTYTVREEYIRAKYTTITDHYAYLYRLLTTMARKYIDIPSDLLYPVWLSPEGTDAIPPSEDSVFLKFDIPEGKYIIANDEVWGHMINHFYFPLNKKDELDHESELARYGVTSSSSLINGNAGNFYPLLRQKILKSWERIYTVEPTDPSNIVGLCWKLESEWLIED